MMDISAGARIAEGAPTLDGWIGLSHGGLSWWGHGRSDGQGAGETASGLVVTSGALESNLLWAWTSAPDRELPFHQGRASVNWQLPGRLSAVRLRGGLGMDLASVTALSRHGGIGYTHPSGCLSLAVDGWFDADRRFPDLRAQIQFLPGRS